MPDNQISQNPIFVVGYPRSGTTLLQALLATQPHTLSFPESHFFGTILPLTNANQDGIVDGERLNQVFDMIHARMGFEFEPHLRRKLDELASHQALSAKGLFETIVCHYILQQETTDPTALRWIEKTPYHIFHLETIYKYYPDALFVNIIRHPIHAIISRRLSLNEALPLDKLTRNWKKAVRAYERFKENCPDRIYLVQYEQLVAKPQAIFTDLSKFLGLESDLEAINRYQQTAQQIILPTESWKTGVLTDSLRNTNTDRKVSFVDTLRIQHILQPEMARYGYDISLLTWQHLFDLSHSIYRGLKAPFHRNRS